MATKKAAPKQAEHMMSSGEMMKGGKHMVPNMPMKGGKMDKMAPKGGRKK